MDLRIGCVQLALGAMLIGIASAWALAPHDKAVGVQAHKQSENAINVQEQTQGNKGITSPAPTLITPPQTPSQQGNAGEQSKDSTEQGTEFWPAFAGYRVKVSDSIVAIAAAITAIFTGLLWRSTEKLWTAGEKQIQVNRRSSRASLTAAQAAQAQVSNALRAELPIIVAQNTAYRPATILPDNQIPEHGELRIKVENFGRPPAELISHCIEASVLHRLPEIPKYYGDFDFPPGSFLTREDPIEMPVMLILSEKDRVDLASGDKHIFLRGYIRFLDFTGQRHEIRFCRMSLYRDDRPGKWFDFVVSAHMPAAYLKRT